MKIVLASASPRRRELLANLGLDYTVLPALTEIPPDPSLSPEEAVVRIAAGKARDAALRAPGDALIIAADTLVWLDGVPLGKPADAADAARMLRLLSGRTHAVLTGVALLRGQRLETAAEKTDVTFREMTEGEIARYVASGEPLDKAGAYGAQGRGAMFIRRIDGDFFNVMGLPVCRLSLMLRDFGAGPE